MAETMLALYDKKVGGRPRAFECLLEVNNFDLCGIVTKTLRGMRQHQRLAHRFKAQGELWQGEKHGPK